MEQYATEIMRAGEMQKFIKWFDAKIGRGRNIMIPSQGIYYACADLTPREAKMCRTYEECFNHHKNRRFNGS